MGGLRECANEVQPTTKKQDTQGQRSLQLEKEIPRGLEDVRQSVLAKLNKQLKTKDDVGTFEDVALKVEAASTEHAERADGILSVEVSKEAYSEQQDEVGCRTTYQDPIESWKMRKQLQMMLDAGTLSTFSPLSNNGMTAATLKKMIQNQGEKGTIISSSMKPETHTYQLEQHLDALLVFDDTHANTSLERECTLAELTSDQVGRELQALAKKEKLKME